MIKTPANKMLIRLLTLVSRTHRAGVPFTMENQNIVLNLKQGLQIVPVATFSTAISDGLIVTSENRMIITKSGISKLKRHLSDCDPHASQHRILQSTTANIQNQDQKVTVNHAESPLARLYARKQKNGLRFITKAQYEAGERLRRDFEKTQMQPSVTARWREGTSTGNTARGSADSSEMSDFAIDARARLERSLNAIGPELAGVTLDICCYLKGFECVERERGWPARSGKLLLKTALAALSRHYGYVAPAAKSQKQSNINQWGSNDYRPQIRHAGRQCP